ncbi:RTA-like protein [Penicillium griseofulvum]|uniref:RTA-like protein n=1 Tax=Penicillium patulum TaxID=5078 RepID=A0A135LD78_PENPA|nr:RTA-like protein [Penicillium griseofulvum]KXG46840.1 RTA-like protein [Penicillium griseofulvum]
MLRAPTAASHKPSIRWQKYLITLYVVSVLIWIRSAFRVIEYLEGNAGSIMRHEAYIFIFDATLMVLVMAWMNWFHPSEIGLLLRNDMAITNGFELFAFTSSYRRAKRQNSAT